MKFTILSIILSLALGCKENRTPKIHYIPEGFTGPLIVVYEEEGFPKLNIIDEAYQLNFPPNGIIITSSSAEYGWAKDRYFYIQKNGLKKEIDSYFSEEGISIQGGGMGSVMNDGKEYSYSEIFIGTKAEYEQAQIKDNLFERIEKEIKNQRVREKNDILE